MAKRIEEITIGEFQDLMDDRRWEVVLPVIKGHMLAEAELDRILDLLYPNPEVFFGRGNSSRSDFYRKLLHLKAHSDGGQSVSRVIESLTLLNNLRNDLVHSLDGDKSRNNLLVRNFLNQFEEKTPLDFIREMNRQLVASSPDGEVRLLNEDLKLAILSMLVEVALLREKFEGVAAQG